MKGSSTQTELLAQFRTLLALERNYLAEERTVLAAFRTGLALILIAPSLYIYSLTLNWELEILGLLLLYGFLILCGSLGAWESIRSRLKLKKIRRLKTAVIDKEKEILNCSEELAYIFTELMNFPIKIKLRSIEKYRNNRIIKLYE
ncbi:MAG: hypothetical protein ACXABG_12180 [Promethearchaeota archaeon]|jgi:uncharacterized membrane protein YidH (DUF202 family)